MLHDSNLARPIDGFLRLSFSDEESTTISAEIERLQALSLVCKVTSSRPNRGELRDLLQGQLLAEIGKIVDIQPLGRGYYQVEFLTLEMATKVRERSPLAIQNSLIHFYPWRHGFSTAADPLAAVAGFSVFVCFPGLRKEYRPFLGSRVVRGTKIRYGTVRY